MTTTLKPITGYCQDMSNVHTTGIAQIRTDDDQYPTEESLLQVIQHMVVLGYFSFSFWTSGNLGVRQCSGAQVKRTGDETPLKFQATLVGRAWYK